MCLLIAILALLCAVFYNKESQTENVQVTLRFMNCILTTVVFISLKYFEFVLFMLKEEVTVLFIVPFFNFYVEGCEYTVAFLGPTVVY